MREFGPSESTTRSSEDELVALAKEIEAARERYKNLADLIRKLDEHGQEARAQIEMYYSEGRRREAEALQAKIWEFAETIITPFIREQHEVWVKLQKLLDIYGSKAGKSYYEQQ